MFAQAIATLLVAIPFWAEAAAYVLPGALPPGCSGSGTTYTCPTLSLAWGDTLEVANNNTTLTVAGTFSPNGNSINWSGRRVGFRLQAATVNGSNYLNFYGDVAATGALTLDSNSNQIIGNVTSGNAMSLGGTITGRVTTGGMLTTQWATAISGAVSTASLESEGGSTYGANVTATSGTVELKYKDVVNGDVTAAGAVTAASGVKVGGDISAGAVSLSSGDVVTGGVTAVGAVTVDWGAQIGGEVSAGSFVSDGGGAYGGKITTNSGRVVLGVSDRVLGGVVSAGSVSMEHESRVQGSVSSTSTVVLDSSEAKVDQCILAPKSGNSKTITLGWHAHVGSVCCNTGGSTNCQNSCVENESGYPLPPTAASTAACLGTTAGVDHYEVDVPATGLTCQTSTLAVRACADASSPCLSSLATASTTTTLSASSGSFISSGGTLQTFTGSTIYTHSLTSAGMVTVGLASASPSASLQCYSYDGSSRSLLATCNFNVMESAFLYSVPDFGAGAGSGTVTISAVRQSDNAKKCVSFTPSGSVKMWTGYVNPMSGTKAASLGYGGAEYTLPPSEPAAGNIPLAFDGNGQATFSLNYWDAGQLRLYAKWNSATGQDDFVVKPYFAVSGLKCADGTINPAASSATGGAFCRAGQAFSATVTAVASDGVTTTPNFGSESPAESVTMSAALVSPSGGNSPPLAGTLIKAGGTPSVASSSALSWPEVGIISLTPRIADGNYLGAGDVGQYAVANVGRFYPDHFDTALVKVGNVPMDCPDGLTCPTDYNGIVYAGQPFSARVTARELGGGTTLNYDGGKGYSHQSALTAVSSKGGSAAPGGSGQGTLSGGSIVASAFGNGVATLSSLAFSFAAPPGSPTAVYLRTTENSAISPAGDGVSSLRSVPAESVEGGVQVVQGRIRLSNVFGQGRIPLEMPVEAQFWSGQVWAPNLKDASSLSPGTVVVYPALTVSSVVFSGGRGVLRFATPAAVGSYDVGVNLGESADAQQTCISSLNSLTTTPAALPWLRSRNGGCASTYDRDPSARVTFGIYAPETRKTIHVRELF